MDVSDKPLGENVPLLHSELTVVSYGAALQSVSACGHVLTDDILAERKIPSPLPVKQLAIIFLMRIVEPIAYTQIFPYINQMMEDLHVVNDPSRVGYYSGVVDSAFALLELCTVLKWGALSDRIGRKPVLLLGLFGVMLSTLLFGFSRSFAWALVMRSASGALSGNVVVLMSSVSELTDESNQAKAYAMIGLAYNVATIIGPVIGGIFAEPTRNFPDTFGSLVLFKEFPYLLPCVISALAILVATFFGAAFFKETLPFKADRQIESQAGMANNTASISEKPMGAVEIASSPVMYSVLRGFFLLSALNTSMNVVFTLFAYTPVELGGLARDPDEIGYAIAFSGAAGAVIQIFVLPVCQRHYGTIALYKSLMLLWPLLFLLFPLLNMIARRSMPIPGFADAPHGNSVPAGPAVWLCISVLLALNRLASMAYSLNLILTKNAAPSMEVLGVVFGLNQLVGCVARAFAPAFVSSLFAFSYGQSFLGGNLVWAVMFCVALYGVWTAYAVRDGAAEKEI